MIRQSKKGKDVVQESQYENILLKWKIDGDIMQILGIICTKKKETKIKLTTEFPAHKKN
jgi:hypothetical protein